jgi:hypothetical protein
MENSHSTWSSFRGLGQRQTHDINRMMEVIPTDKAHRIPQLLLLLSFGMAGEHVQ